MLRFAIGVTNRLLLRKQKGNMNCAVSSWRDYDQVKSGVLSMCMVAGAVGPDGTGIVGHIVTRMQG